MALMGEATAAPPSLAAVLDAGVSTLSQNQSITFTQYQRQTLSPDGTVFWVNTGTTANFAGSLHYLTDRHQNEDETVAMNRFIFTAQEEVTAFNTVNPSLLWIGAWTVDGTTLHIAFSDRGSFYQQADQWHYGGYAVYPAMASQLVNSAANLPVGPIVSNSLPIWLSFNTLAPVYPSFLVPDNVQPPYVVAHVDPMGTDPLGQFPVMSWPGVTLPNTGASPLHSVPVQQLMRDKVRLTFYGFTHAMAVQFYASLLDASLATPDALFGFCNSPVIRDDRRTQPEIAAVAMKKTLDIEASYYTTAVDAFTRRLILSAALSN